MWFVYILYSEKLDKYYIGESHDVELRLNRHNTGYYSNKWAEKGKPWVLYLKMKCTSRSQALKVEKHIKSMKSKKYIQNLKKYEELRAKLLARFSTQT